MGVGEVLASSRGGWGGYVATGGDVRRCEKVPTIFPRLAAEYRVETKLDQT